MSQDLIFETSNLTKHFPLKNGKGAVHALDDVSLSVRRGATLSVVGESGCGKSTFARTAIRLLEPTDGAAILDGENLMALSRKELQHRRRDMQIVFQDPFASLNPRRSVEKTLMEPMVIHGVGTPAERRERMLELLDTVGLQPDAAKRYPHEFSGGQRQRIGIARAIALRPKLVLADEPVSALDVSTQSQILNLLVELKDRLALSYVFISHDLAVVKHISDRVAVMYLGRVVEEADVDELYDRPLHPYTQALLSAIPRARFGGKVQRTVLTGDIPDPSAPPSGCRFHPRCPQAMGRCSREEPFLTSQDAPGDGGRHLVSCHLHG